MPKQPKLKWMSQPALGQTGVTWGVPWREGEVKREDQFLLAHSDGTAASAVQTWPLAYWPDGSVKWSGHSAVCQIEQFAQDKELTLIRSEGLPSTTKSQPALTLHEQENEVTINTGVITCTISKGGPNWLKQVSRLDGTILCTGAVLVASKSGYPYESSIHSAIVEQQGPIRAVVKVEGKHRSVDGTTVDPESHEWLPFVLRLYFYAGLVNVRVVHTFHYDGDPERDFVEGLGLSFQLPMRGPFYNRHVRLAGDQGYFAESPKTLHTRRTKGKYREWFEAQTRGEPLSFDPVEDSYFLELLRDSATWDSFKLVQNSSEFYRISKRTKKDCCWLKAVDGRRSGGLVYIGGEGGGLAAGVRHFWKKSPSSIEVEGMAADVASLKLWLWSPDHEPMDLRHYDTETHVESSYEGAEELRATPYGIANTNEITLWFTDETPSMSVLQAMEQDAEEPPLLVCEPAYYHQQGAFGLWSLPDRSTSAKALLEDRLDGITAFYMREVEVRKWYGFWDFGDFMHSYDPVRHVWNYDLGGCAWQNAELVPNMWLWTMFLRSGRPELFRLAEAMTRHTSEVDVYHFGEYAGLGSRHNVVHWGCGCKEARIAMAGLHRYYYYLTADERVGDLLDLVKDADHSTVLLDPMRAYFPKDEHPTHIRVGPDWAAFSSNWMTRWERFEDTRYRDKLLVGLECIKKAKYRLISGPTYGYDPATGVLTPMGEDNYGRHLAICMGGPQVWFELAAMLKDPEWEDMMAEFGVYYNLPQEEKDLLTQGEVRHQSFEHPVLSAGIAAYGAYRRSDSRTARRVWEILLENLYARTNLLEEAQTVLHKEQLHEIDWINTNEAAQWSLNTILSLELIPEYLPEKLM